jgi:hypothetical protein
MVVIHGDYNLLENMYRPSIKHGTFQSAYEEAQRLAKRFKMPYMVLETVGGVDGEGNPKQVGEQP